eukprot:CAMPEP_0180408092 /NCGR_PEP_ID=MMETSP0989-20121125/42086_1 /TAXON_ID=697907 /ORGANISM="non described non described, Strain CCMP2293" /LENGTH=91 /DNA_ID=CAMNT_0022411995 /DNA_START=966 /DNA_END=1237 /DNA_ORIENTATION=+
MNSLKFRSLLPSSSSTPPAGSIDSTAPPFDHWLLAAALPISPPLLHRRAKTQARALVPMPVKGPRSPERLQSSPPPDQPGTEQDRRKEEPA